MKLINQWNLASLQSCMYLNRQNIHMGLSLLWTITGHGYVFFYLLHVFKWIC